MTTKVVHVKSQEWKDTPDDQRVYIGRAVPRRGFQSSEWKNQFSIGRHGTREDVLSKHEVTEKGMMRYRRRTITDNPFRVLRGKVLGCWCAPEPCHGDLLARLADMSEAEFEEWLGS